MNEATVAAHSVPAEPRPAERAARVVPVIALLHGCAMLVSACAPGAPGPRILLDGELDDWTNIAPAHADPLENGPGAVDLGEIRVASDDSALYLLLDLGRAANLQAMNGALRLLLDTDNDPSTGESAHGLVGVDRVIEFSANPRADRFGAGMLVRTTGDTAAARPVEIGLHYAPTFASRHFEIRIARRVFASNRTRMKLVHVDAEGRVLDETDAFDASLRGGPAVAVVKADTIPRVAGATLRLLTWNVSDRALLTRTDAFARILAALDPDVVLFDEMSREIDARRIETFLAQSLTGEWTVVMGQGGGRQHTAVASRLPITPDATLARVAYPDSVALLDTLRMPRQPRNDMRTFRVDGIPVVGARVHAGGRTILLVALDLSCCGYAGSEEDRFRIMASSAVHDAIAGAVAAGGIDAVVVGGDFNLVGSRTPVDVMARALDPAGGNLASIDGIRLNGVSNASWRSPTDIFPPGRLDWILYSPSSLFALRSFTFATEDLSAEVLAELGLEREDSERASDHLPIVADYRVGRR